MLRSLAGVAWLVLPSELDILRSLESLASIQPNTISEQLEDSISLRASVRNSARSPKRLGLLRGRHILCRCELPLCTLGKSRNQMQ